MASMTLNRNAVHGDASALSPGGVRIGSPAMTSRGCGTEDFRKIAEFLDRCCQIALKAARALSGSRSPGVRATAGPTL